MEYLIDSANLEEIKYANEFYPIVGVTTNPTLIAKEKTDFVELITSIRKIIGNDKMIHVQTTASKAEDIVKEAKMLKEKVGGEFYVKIPISEEALKATMQLKKLGIGVTMTAIFTSQQALIAAKAGADYVAPYVNRLDNICDNGISVVADSVNTFNIHGISTKVLAASFKNVFQVQQVADCGGHSSTICMDVLRGVVSHPMTEVAIEGFEKDWKSVYGDKSVAELLS